MEALPIWDVGDYLNPNIFWKHCQAISALSRMLLVSFMVILVVLVIMSILNAIGYWELKDMMILITTFL